jgi:hypothetical protein
MFLKRAERLTRLINSKKDTPWNSRVPTFTLVPSHLLFIESQN